MRAFALTATGSLFVFGLFAAVASACADDAVDPPAPVAEASPEATFGEASAEGGDADVPLGDLCGDTRGLEPNAPWPMRGGCPKRANASTQLGPQTSQVKWTVPMPALESSAAVSADQLVWVGLGDGNVIVMSGAGIVQSGLPTGGPIRSSPARSVTGVTVIGGGDGALYGVERIPLSTPDAGDGGDEGGADAGDDAGGDAGLRRARQVWRLPVGPIASSPALGSDGTIYVGTTDGKLVAVLADGSAVKWTAVTNDTTGSSPALAPDGTIYVGSSDGKLYALTPDGAVAWTYAAGAPVSGSPVLGGDDTIYVGAADGKLHAVMPDGKPRWVYATGGAITGAAAVRAGTVVVGSADKKVHAVRVVDGTAKWTFATLGEVGIPLIATDDTVYVGSMDGRLYAITPTGLLYFAINLRGRTKSAPAVTDDGTLIVTTDTGIVAIGL